MDITTATPAEIDTEIVATQHELQRAGYAVEREAERLQEVFSPLSATTNSWRRTYTMNIAECVAAARAWAAGDRTGTAPQYSYVKPEDLLANLDAASATYRAHEARIDELEAEYTRRGGWSRFYLVPGGHIHSTTYCSTCNKLGAMTRFNWVTDLSGKIEAECVAEHGALLCTVCYPTAPVEWTNFYEEREAAKKAARCAGTGSYPDASKPSRTGYYTGNWGACPVCGTNQTVLKSGRIRTHKGA